MYGEFLYSNQALIIQKKHAKNKKTQVTQTIIQVLQTYISFINKSQPHL